MLKFRHLLEKQHLGEQLFVLTNRYLEERGFKVSSGTIVAATISDAPRSTKNRDHARDPEMGQTKKGNQGYFGMKAHLGVDSGTKLIHSVVATAANVHDSPGLEDRLHGGATRVWGEAAYTGQTARVLSAAPGATDFTHNKGCKNKPLAERERTSNRAKSSVRAKVAHVFHILKCQFGFVKLRYRGLHKNANHLFAACALANMAMAARKWRAASGAQSAHGMPKSSKPSSPPKKLPPSGVDLPGKHQSTQKNKCV